MHTEQEIDSLRTALLEGRFDVIIGLIEGTRLDFKGSPYTLSQGDHYYYELAKDVSAFANASGGLLVLGIATTVNPDHPGEEASELRPFPRQLLKPNQYQQILRSWIYPPLEGVEIHWVPEAPEANRGLAFIWIPEQTGKPYLVTKGFTPEGKKLGTLVGLYRRARDLTEELKAPELQALLQNGLRFDQLIQQRFESLESRIDQFKSLAPAGGPVADREPPTSDLLIGRMNDAVRDVGLGEEPAYLLAACPAEFLELSGLVESSSSDLIRLLENPPKLRNSGFNLDTGDPARLIRGQLRRVMVHGRQLLELWRDGTAVFSTFADEDFLCWGKPPEPRTRVINAVALIESTFNFVVLLKNAYPAAPTPPENIQLRLEFRRLLTGVDRCVLLPGMGWRNDPISWHRATIMELIQDAPAEDYAVSLKLPWSLDAGVMCYRLVREVYGWFGMPHDKVPYTKPIGDEVGISHEAIRMIGR